MPWHHRYIGNPALSFLGRVFFRSPIGDFHCGLRGFDRAAVLGLHLRTTGMEFASEMVVKATLSGLRVTEVPTTLAPDGRSRRPHLRSFRDGWRHLRFLLMFSPRWLFLYPGLALCAIGLFLGALLIRGPVPIGPSMQLGIHTFLIAAMCIIVGVQGVCFAMMARRFATHYGFIPRSPVFHEVLEALTLERVLAFAALLVVIGLGALIWGFAEWARRGFGDLLGEATIRAVVIALTAIVVGLQTMMSAFLASMIDVPLAEGRLNRPSE
jgi:hypothetical protein